MSKLFSRLVKDEEGASAAEYAVILAIITAGLVTAVTNLSGSIAGVMASLTTYLGTIAF
jgi:pilus assembly protein Flp/PilA